MTADVAATIQLALAPAFLLVGIGQFLILAAGRLARVVDRARALAAALPAAPGAEHAEALAELRLLDRRMRVVNAAIFVGTMATVAVCLLVASLFLARLTGAELEPLLAGGFIAAMALLVCGLILFLWEVRLAARSIHVRADLVGRRQG